MATPATPDSSAPAPCITGFGAAPHTSGIGWRPRKRRLPSWSVSPLRRLRLLNHAGEARCAIGIPTTVVLRPGRVLAQGTGAALGCGLGCIDDGGSRRRNAILDPVIERGQVVPCRREPAAAMGQPWHEIEPHEPVHGLLTHLRDDPLVQGRVRM